MKIKQLLFLILLTILFSECKKSTNYGQQNLLENYYKDGYIDGTYCAEIDYYYSETGTSSTYTLLVEIENNELTKIHWPNGGWLDDSHFNPPDISSGEASFISDRGVDYTVRIMGNEEDCFRSTNARDEDELIQQKEDSEYEEDERRQEEEENEE